MGCFARAKALSVGLCPTILANKKVMLMKLRMLLSLSLLITVGCISQTGSNNSNGNTGGNSGGGTLGSTTLCDFLSAAELDSANASAVTSNDNGGSQQSFLDTAYVNNLCELGGSRDAEVTAADCLACAELVAVSVWQDCGDAVCGEGENCGNCAKDCGDCCGNDTCDTYEGLDEVTNCPGDCDFAFCSFEVSNLACVDICGCRRVVRFAFAPCLVMGDNVEGGQCSLQAIGTCCVCEGSPDTCE